MAADLGPHHDLADYFQLRHEFRSLEERAATDRAEAQTQIAALRSQLQHHDVIAQQRAEVPGGT